MNYKCILRSPPMCSLASSFGRIQDYNSLPFVVVVVIRFRQRFVDRPNGEIKFKKNKRPLLAAAEARERRLGPWPSFLEGYAHPWDHRLCSDLKWVMS